jgi:acetyl-CoA C-acetyltransferase
LSCRYDDVFLLDGVRTAFADYCGALGGVSPIDLGIKAARAVLERAQVPGRDVGQVIAGSMAQASFDAYMLPRHVGLYAGVPLEAPAILVQRVCGTGFEAIAQAGDLITLGKTDLVLCVGAESMTRNPVAAYTHRTGFRMGQVEFKDFLWEALLDPAGPCTMGQTAENLARKYEITRAEVDAFAADSFARAVAAQQEGFLAGEIVPVVSESFELEGYRPRGIKLDRQVPSFAADSHIRPTSLEVLGKLKPAFGGVQTGGNSSGIVARAGRHRSPSCSLPPRWACRRRSWASARCRRSSARSRRRASPSATSIASRSTRPSARSASRSSAPSGSTMPRSTSMAAPSPSAIRWPRPACGSP